MVSQSDVDAAVQRIAERVRRTPVVHSGPGTFGLPYSVMVKLESLQHGGSFKVRGGFNAALAHGVPADGLIAASGGNHGIAVAHVARALGVRAEIFVPGVSAAVKIQRIRDRGAQVAVVGEFYADAQRACDLRAADIDALSIHPYDEPLTVAGQATLGVELWDQAGPFDTVLVAVGGGGLAAGLAASLPSSVRIVCVEPTLSRCLGAALQAGAPDATSVGGVAADSLGAQRIGDLPWELLHGRVDHVEVSDTAILDARRRLWDDLGVVAETGASVALAALTSGAYVPADRERVAVVVCGSNTDPADLSPGAG